MAGDKNGLIGRRIAMPYSQHLIGFLEYIHDFRSGQN